MPKMNNRPALSPPTGRCPGSGAVVLLALGLVVLAPAAGCSSRDEKVTRYTVPKDSKPPQRLLGAIVPHSDRTWFFKLLGPQTAVDKHEKEFTQFVESVRFPDKGEKPISWVSIATPPSTSANDNAVFSLRAQQAMGLLVEQDVPRQLITINEGAAREEKNVRLRFFGK